MDSMPSIADLLERVPSWVGRAVTWQRLQGGLSHHIYRVDADGSPYVLRILEPAVSAAGLGDAKDATTKADREYYTQLSTSPLVFPQKADFAKLHRYRVLSKAEEKVWNGIFEPIYQS